MRDPQKPNSVMPGNEHKWFQEVDKCVYSRFDSSGSGVIICLYVDDMLIFGTDQLQVDETKSLLSSKFYHEKHGIVSSNFEICNVSVIATDHLQVDKVERLMTSKFVMTDLGEVDMILGIRIKRVNKGIASTQSHYVEKILKKFNYSDCSPVSTPMDPRVMTMPNKGLAVSQPEYSQALGCLMYAMIRTRPDIAYAVGRLSRYTSNPGTQHWQTIKRVFKYLKGAMDYFNTGHRLFQEKLSE
ncbi:hypothetical protein OSB04_un000260 [Centaurea solstitialis]|uniref:Reverse transcriptase Ty1/copia-type domain-containing protein n=1 Tax=Centaurea solstitialis TaxID=347529 RepID=A0AA38SHR5_9ASTR|nr:hypothetical protein OSB04_un000260 [Centaurea solstitialis]